MKIYKKDDNVRSGGIKASGRNFDGAKKEKRSTGRSFEGGRREGKPSVRNLAGGLGESRSTTYKAVCSECGKDCEVPFKPNGKKPVFCSFCFAKNDENKTERPIVKASDNQLDNINEKLDKILRLLNKISR